MCFHVSHPFGLDEWLEVDILIPALIHNVQVKGRAMNWYRYNHIEARVGMEAVGHLNFQVLPSDIFSKFRF